MSGYIDDMTDPTSRSAMLISHLQSQSYSHRISTTQQSHRGDVDDDSDHDEHLSVSTWDSEEEDRLAQQEWDESVAQLQLILQVMVVPFFGKWLGRKWSYWAFTRYQRHGITAAFFGLEWLWAPVTIVPDAAVAAVQP